MADDRKDDKTSRHDLAIARFKLASEAYSSQRARELEALNFAALNQWPDDIKRQRAGEGPPGTPSAVAPRPCLTIDKVGQPIQQVTNAQKNARLAIKISPKSNGASQEIATTFQGLIRNIDVDSRATIARNWAYERMAQCGLGYYRIHKKYANDGDFDQDITIERILNQGSVYLDPYAQEPDWSDGMWALVTEDLPMERYQQLYGEKDTAGNYKGLAGRRDEELMLLERDSAFTVKRAGNSEELTTVGDRIPGWVQQTEAGWSVRVAEYWYVTYEKAEIALFVTPEGNEEVGYLGDKPVGNLQPIPEGATIGQKRTIQNRRVDWCLIDGDGILKETEWEGRYIPIVPVVGKEYNVGGTRRWMGVVEPAMDACKLFNYTASAIAEGTAIIPKAPFILDPEQIAGYESQWKEANTRNFPYLGRRAFDDRGNPYPPIERQTAEPPVQALSMLLAQADNYIKATTGVFDPSLGNLSPGERSGKAILALQKQSEQGNSNYLDNMATISMTLEGKILLDLIPHVYDRAGRIVRILGNEDKPDSVMLGQPFVKGKDGQPQPPTGMEPPQAITTIDLAKGEYSVVVDISKGHSTRRQETSGAMIELMGAVPPLAPVIAPFAVREMDFPGSHDMAETLMKTLPPNLQPMEDGQPKPEVQVMVLNQKLQQQGQMMDLAMKDLNEKTRIIEIDEVKAKAQVELERQKQDAETYRAHLDNQAKMEIERIKVAGDLLKTRATLEANQTKAMLDAALAELDMQIAQAGQREAAQTASLEADKQREFEREEGDAAREQEVGLAGLQQSHEQQMAEQQAAQQPTE